MELKVILTNESNGESTSTGTTETPQSQPQTTSGQQKINSAKQKASASNVAKSVMTTAFSVAQTGLQLYNTYSTITNSLDGNSAYSNYVSKRTKWASTGLSCASSFLMGTAMSGGNIFVGGLSSIITLGTTLATEQMEWQQNKAEMLLSNATTGLNRARLGSANNIWRK